MTTKAAHPLSATPESRRRKLVAKIAAAQKEADAAKKEARAAKIVHKESRKKFKEARRAAKQVRKAVKMLKEELRGLGVKKKRSTRTRKSTVIKPSGESMEPVMIPGNEPVPPQVSAAAAPPDPANAPAP